MSWWSQSGDGKHEKVNVSGSINGDKYEVQHVKASDSNYGDKSLIVTTTYENGNESGHTTVHGNDHVNHH